jgi:hypothetical protein
VAKVAIVRTCAKAAIVRTCAKVAIAKTVRIIIDAYI